MLHCAKRSLDGICRTKPLGRGTNTTKGLCGKRSFFMSFEISPLPQNKSVLEKRMKARGLAFFHATRSMVTAIERFPDQPKRNRPKWFCDSLDGSNGPTTINLSRFKRPRKVRDYTFINTTNRKPNRWEFLNHVKDQKVPLQDDTCTDMPDKPNSGALRKSEDQLNLLGHIGPRNSSRNKVTQ